MHEKSKGTIFVVGTPIGNLGDITLRALETLKKVDVIVAEDTRRTLKLLNHYEIKKPLVSYHKHNEEKRAVELIKKLEAGENIAVVSDAGMPGISDPGQKLLSMAWEKGIKAVVIPGVSAVTAALSISGFSSTPFAFYGFPPAKGKERVEFFETLAQERSTSVLFESPVRFRRTLKDLAGYLGNRNILVAREITKVHEEIFRGTIEDALLRWEEQPRGEITIVVEAAGSRDTAKSAETTDEVIREELEKLLKAGFSTRDATKRISGKYSISRSIVYREALQIMKEIGCDENATGA